MYYFSRAICGLKTKAGHTKYRRIPNENIRTISFNCYPNSMWVNQFGNYVQPLKVKRFLEMFKNAENWKILLVAKSQFLDILFKT